MALLLPGGIPIAALATRSLDGIGTLQNISSFSSESVLALWPKDPRDENSIWVSPSFRNYAGAWDAAAREGLVDSRHTYGTRVDIDHLYPKSWASLPGMQMKWVRIFPVWAEVNRSAGVRERWMLDGFRKRPKRLGDLVFADELQILKLSGHPVGTSKRPACLFASGR